MNITFSDFVLYFMLYSFLGWICEVVYCSIPAKKIVNRGFLAGPYCPIYGFGALIILFLLHPFKVNPPLLFVFAVIATTLLEYVTSWAMEALFGIRWWDYSNKKYNLNGRIYMQNSLIFGALGVILTYLVHPLTLQLVLGISSEYKRVIASLLLAAVAIDLITTLNTLVKLNERLKKLKALLEMAEKYNAEYTWFDGRDLKGSFLRRKYHSITLPRPVRVCAYVRVSTGHDKQMNSLRSQTEYYELRFTNNPQYIFIGIFSDAGISG